MKNWLRGGGKAEDGSKEELSVGDLLTLGRGLEARIQLETRLREDAGVACLSGTSFGAHGDGYLRFSYANSVENIEEALRRFAAFLEAAPAKA